MGRISLESLVSWSSIRRRLRDTAAMPDGISVCRAEFWAFGPRAYELVALAGRRARMAARTWSDSPGRFDHMEMRGSRYDEPRFDNQRLELDV